MDRRGMSTCVEQVKVSFDISRDSIAKLYGPANGTWDKIEAMFGVRLQNGQSTDNVFERISIRGKRTAVEGAKDYVMALCDEAEVEKQVRFPAEFQNRLRGAKGERLVEIEKASWALVRIGTDVATVRGSEAACNSAVEIIEVFVRFFKELKQQGITDASQFDCFPYQRVRARLASLEGGSASNVDTLVAFATQVGWSEAQALSVIKVIGSDVDADTLVNYLMKEYPCSSDSPRPTSPPRVKAKTEAEPSDAYLETETSTEARTGLRPIVVDGSNVAMSYSKGKYFACIALKKCVDYFQKLGHEKIFVLVPVWRKENSRPEAPIEDQDILEDLHRRDILSYTPARRLNGKRIAPYDDRFIVEIASIKGGVVVSNDYFRDLVKESEEFRETIEQHVLPYTWVDGIFMPARDPLGKDGPTLTEFLRFPSSGDSEPKSQPSHVHPRMTTRGCGKICPYGTRCTFGLSCSFRHPERENDAPEVVASNAISSRHSVDSQGVTARGGPRVNMYSNELDSLPAGPCSFVETHQHRPQPTPPAPPQTSIPDSHMRMMPPPPQHAPHGYPGQSKQTAGFLDHSYQDTTTGIMPSMAYGSRPYHTQDPAESRSAYPHQQQQQQQQQQQHFGGNQFYALPRSGQFNVSGQHHQQQHHQQQQQPGRYAMSQQHRGDYSGTFSGHPLPPDFPEYHQTETPAHGSFQEPPDVGFSDRQPSRPMPQHPPVPDLPPQSCFRTMPDSGRHQMYQPDPFQQRSFPSMDAMPSYQPPMQRQHIAPQRSDRAAQMARNICQQGTLVKDFCRVNIRQVQQQEEFVCEVIRAHNITDSVDLYFHVREELSRICQQNS